MRFLSWRAFDHDGAAVWVSRSGYTGEDGFEISLPLDIAQAFALRLLAHEDVAPIGLGARDSLRLEAGLLLYGHDIDETTDPVEAGLLWSIGKRRRAEGGFPGFERIRAAITEGPSRRRVGLAPQGKAPVREGAELLSPDGRIVGSMTSGGFSPSLCETHRHGLCRARLRGDRDARSQRNCAAGASNCASRRCPLSPHRYFQPGKDQK